MGDVSCRAGRGFARPAVCEARRRAGRGGPRKASTRPTLEGSWRASQSLDPPYVRRVVAGLAKPRPALR